MTDKYEILEDSVRKMYASAVWSHKIQEKQADICEQKYRTLETISIICASLTSVGIISTIFDDQLWIKILSAILSFVTGFVAAYFKMFEPDKQAKNHKESANNLLIVRNNIQCLITSIKLREKTVAELEDLYQKLNDEANQEYKSAPQTTDKAVKLAKIALHVTKDNTFSEDEINSYLPEALQKRK